MPRTRDALLIIVGFICTAIVAGFVITSRGEESLTDEHEATTPHAIFLIPQESYEVTPYVDDSFSDSRESFIEKVRSTYPEVEIIEEPPVIISAPVTEVVPSDVASTTDGDSSL